MLDKPASNSAMSIASSFFPHAPIPSPSNHTRCVVSDAPCVTRKSFASGLLTHCVRYARFRWSERFISVRVPIQASVGFAVLLAWSCVRGAGCAAHGVEPALNVGAGDVSRAHRAEGGQEVALEGSGVASAGGRLPAPRLAAGSGPSSTGEVQESTARLSIVPLFQMDGCLAL